MHAAAATSGVAVQSTIISSRDSANLAFYGRQHTAQALLTGSAVPPPPVASALYQVPWCCAGQPAFEQWVDIHHWCAHFQFPANSCGKGSSW